MGLTKRLYAALKRRRNELGWTIASSILGGVIGLTMAALYVRGR